MKQAFDVENYKKAGTKTFLIVLLLLFLCGSIRTVNPGERGVRVTLGKVSPQSLQEGIHFKWPLISKIVKMNVKTQKQTTNTAVYTKDIQQANLVYVLNYNLKPEYVPTMYRTVGTEYKETIITPIVEGIVKDATGKWIANDLVSNRERATVEILTNLKKELDSRGIIVTAFSITNIDYNDEFEKAVEEKVKAQQEALKAKNKTVQVEEEAKQRLTKARAEAEAIRIQAAALKANKDLVELEKVKAFQTAVSKWDGSSMPQVMGGGIPLLDLKLK